MDTQDTDDDRCHVRVDRGRRNRAGHDTATDDSAAVATDDAAVAPAFTSMRR